MIIMINDRRYLNDLSIFFNSINLSLDQYLYLSTQMQQYKKKEQASSLQSSFCYPSCIRILHLYRINVSYQASYIHQLIDQKFPMQYSGDYASQGQVLQAIFSRKNQSSLYVFQPKTYNLFYLIYLQELHHEDYNFQLPGLFNQVFKCFDKNKSFNLLIPFAFSFFPCLHRPPLEIFRGYKYIFQGFFYSFAPSQFYQGRYTCSTQGPL